MTFTFVLIVVNSIETLNRQGLAEAKGGNIGGFGLWTSVTEFGNSYRLQGCQLFWASSLLTEHEHEAFPLM